MAGEASPSVSQFVVWQVSKRLVISVAVLRGRGEWSVAGNMWHSKARYTTLKGNQLVFLRLHVFHALAIAFGVRQLKLCNQPTCSLRLTASMPE